MCTSIVEIVEVSGAGNSEAGWFPLKRAAVSYDHPHHALLEDAITIDFVNAELGPAARTAVEITLESARALLGALERVIAEAEEGGRAGGSQKSEGRRQTPAVREHA
jgi:hypothetical protein